MAPADLKSTSFMTLISCMENPSPHQQDIFRLNFEAYMPSLLTIASLSSHVGSHINHGPVWELYTQRLGKDSRL